MFGYGMMMSGNTLFAASGEWIDLANAASGGNVPPWADPQNALGSDNAYATQTGSSDTLIITNLVKLIPDGVTVQGVKVRFERHTLLGVTSLGGFFSLTKDGISGVGSVRSLSAPTNTTDAYAEVGGSGDLWGTTLTPDEINANTFGAILYLGVDNGDTLYVDHVQIAVFYN